MILVKYMLMICYSTVKVCSTPQFVSSQTDFEYSLKLFVCEDTNEGDGVTILNIRNKINMKSDSRSLCPHKLILTSRCYYQMSIAYNLLLTHIT